MSVGPKLKRKESESHGARFYKCALQVNPPGYLNTFRSRDHGLEPDQYIEQVMQTCKQEDISVIAVANHNDVSDIEAFRQAASRYDITVFPGVEVCSSEGIHLLCLYGPDVSIDQLQINLGALGVKRSGPSSDLSQHNFTMLLGVVKGQGGVTVAAHVTSEKGLLMHNSGQARAHMWTDENLLAVQIPGGGVAGLQDHRQIVENTDPVYRRRFPVAVINAKDVKHPDDLRDPAATTAIKMTSRSIEGLRHAFLDPGSRIRLNTDPPPESHTEFKTLAWQGGFLDGVSIEFEGNLNVLIGGRGTGKSTVVESLRYVLGLEPLGEDARKSHQGIVRNVLKSGTRISLRLSSPHPSQREYTIERTIPNAPIVRSGDELLNLAPSDVAPNVDVYGQHEISELAKSKEKLTQLLARFVESDPDSARRKQELKQALQRSRQRILEAGREMEQVQARLDQLPALEETQQRFQDAGLEDKLKERSLLVREERILTTAVSERIEPLHEAVEDVVRALPIDTAFLSSKALEGLPNGAILFEAKSVLDSLGSDLSALSGQAKDRLAMASGQLQRIQTLWGQAKSKGQAEYEKLLRELQKVKIDGEEFIRLRQQIESLRPLHERLYVLQRDIKEHENVRRRLLIEWEDLGGADFRRIEKAAKTVSKALREQVRVRVSFAGNREPLETFLRDKLGGRLQETLSALKQNEDFSLRDFASACRAGKDTLAQRYRLTPAQADGLAKAPPAVFMEMEELDLQPTARIELNTAAVGQPSNWQLLDDLSTGQKATAVLLLLLLESDWTCPHF
jgi:DNA repair ATPase RecN